jgi:hypothetical protein
MGRFIAYLCQVLLFLCVTGAVAQSVDTIRVGSLYQIGVMVQDPADVIPPLDPLFNAPFSLHFQKGAQPADTSTFKLWSLKNSAKKFASGDTFTTPIDSAHPDTCYASCAPGLRYFFLASLDSGLITFSIQEGSMPSSPFKRLLFYFPQFRFYTAGGTEITATTTLSSETGEYTKIVVKAFKPDGSLDSTLSSPANSYRQKLRPIVPAGSGLEFFSVDTSGQLGNEIDSVIIDHGQSSFYVKSSTPLNGSSFGFDYVLYSQVSAYRPMDTVSFPGKLTVNYGDAPSMDSAAIYDEDGDGLGDRVTAWFNSALDSVPRNLVMSWPKDSAMGPASTQGGSLVWSAGATQIEATVDEKATPAGSVAEGDFGVTVIGKSGNFVQTSAEIKDRIGPVILAVTILPGRNGEQDTLVVRFNKELDSSFTAGDAFLVDGDLVHVTGQKVSDRTWRYVLDEDGSALTDAGDSIWIAVAGGIKAWDGNDPNANNRPAVIRNAGSLPPLSQDGNGFYDSDRDGRLDSISIEFTEALSPDQLDSIDFRFVWKDTLGNPIELHPDPSQLVLDPLNPKRVIWKLNADSLAIMPYLTSITDADYGYGNIINRWDVNGEILVDTIPISMRDRMAPVLVTANLWPVSTTAKKGDSLMIRFSEPVDTASLATLDFLQFLVTGLSQDDLGKATPFWSDSGRVLGIRLATKVPLKLRPDPGDSLRILAMEGGIQDTMGNVFTGTGKSILLEGDARVLSETLFSAGVKARAEIGKDVPVFASGRHQGEPMPISADFWEGDAQVSDLPAGSLGILLDVAQSTIGEKDSIDSSVALDYSKIGMKWQLDVFTNIGGFVATSSGVIHCDDPGFEGNCFANRKQVYIAWNLLSQEGRKAGFGVYVAQLNIRVYGHKPYQIVKQYNWGVGPCRTGGDKFLCRN